MTNDQGAVALWDAAAKRFVAGDPSEGHRAGIRALEAVDDGTLRAVDEEGRTLLWDVKRGRASPEAPPAPVPPPLGRPDVAPKIGPEGLLPDLVARSRDGKRLAGAGDGWIAIADAATGARVALLAGLASTPSALAFSPDGRTLYSGSRDSTILGWPVPTAKAGGR